MRRSRGCIFEPVDTGVRRQRLMIISSVEVASTPLGNRLSGGEEGQSTSMDVIKGRPQLSLKFGWKI